MIVAILLAAAMAPSSDAAQERLYRQSRYWFSACGMPGDDMRVEWSAVLQDNQLFIASWGQPSTQELACVARTAARHHVNVAFDETTTEARYLKAEAKRPEARTARRRLAAEARFASLPHFQPSRDDLAAFLPRLEIFCHLQPGSWLHSTGKEVLVQARSRNSTQDYYKFTCLMQALDLAFPRARSARPAIGLVVQDAP